MSIVEKIAIIWLVLIVLLIWLGHLANRRAVPSDALPLVAFRRHLIFHCAIRNSAF
jgi:hypothetical protein